LTNKKQTNVTPGIEETNGDSFNGKSWAIITGGSDGIGLSMAKYLAEDNGFNICIVGRNQEKLE